MIRQKRQIPSLQPCHAPMIPLTHNRHEAAATGPSPPGINCPSNQLLERSLWGKTDHADIISVQQDLLQLGVVARVIAIAQQSDHASPPQELRGEHTTPSHLQEPYLRGASLVTFSMSMRRKKRLVAHTDVIIETEQSAAEFCEEVRDVERRRGERGEHALVAFHYDPDLGSDAFIDQLWGSC